MPKKKDPRIEKAKERAKKRKEAGIMAKEAVELRARAERAEKTAKERVSGKRSQAEDAVVAKRAKISTPTGAGSSVAASLNKKADALEKELRKIKRSL